MVTRIELVKENGNARHNVFRAIAGDKQAAGKTPGQALDALRELMAAQSNGPQPGTLIIVQDFQPDAFFTAEQQARLRELMDRFHDAMGHGPELSPAEKQELEQLVDTEWQGAINRASAILEKLPRPSP